MSENQKLPISLVMIVRNSAGRLKEVITAHKDLVSEVVVIDQSSDDGTYEEALEHADLVLRTRNKGACEADRNLAFSLGNMPWVLNLDDDEFLSDDLKAALPRLLNSDVDIVWFKRDNLVDGLSIKEQMGDDPQCRLFKKDSLNWSDAIHTYPTPVNGANVLHSDFWINHVRTLAGIKATHEKRKEVLTPQNLDQERGFIAMVENALKGIK